tara:strand:- start:77 stop:919 length:843 start_codon:yes stop_codon:yes gene_type:complete
MAVALGTEVYKVDHLRVVARGKSHSVSQRDAALVSDVRALIQDDKGSKKAAALTSSLNLTGFATKNLNAVLNGGSPPKDWEVGEAYGEAYLGTHKRCHFPWSDRWDERKDKSSLPGSDLVGLQETGTPKSPSFRFAFGEVKTSTEKKCPPGVMYGKEGLKKQMEDLRDQHEIRNTLVRYLTMRAQGADWEDKFKEALVRFLAESTDVAIFGVLIRDVSPAESDLKTRSKNIAKKHPPKMHIELLAIYLPSGSINNLGTTFAPAGSKTKATTTGVKKKGGK